jgi:hypothetical protein
MATARFKIGSKVYNTALLEEITLRDLMLFNTQAEDMGLSERWSDVERTAMEMSELDEDAAEKHPGKMLMIGVTIWASRRLSGEAVTFEEAVDVPMASIVFLPATGDRKPGPTKARKGAAKKTTKAVSAPVASVDASSDETPTTSEDTSTPE